MEIMVDNRKKTTANSHSEKVIMTGFTPNITTTDELINAKINAFEVPKDYWIKYIYTEREPCNTDTYAHNCHLAISELEEKQIKNGGPPILVYYHHELSTPATITADTIKEKLTVFQDIESNYHKTNSTSLYNYLKENQIVEMNKWKVFDGRFANKGSLNFEDIKPVTTTASKYKNYLLFNDAQLKSDILTSSIEKIVNGRILIEKKLKGNNLTNEIPAYVELIDSVKESIKVLYNFTETILNKNLLMGLAEIQIEIDKLKNIQYVITGQKISEYIKFTDTLNEDIKLIVTNINIAIQNKVNDLKNKKKKAYQDILKKYQVERSTVENYEDKVKLENSMSEQLKIIRDHDATIPFIHIGIMFYNTSNFKKLLDFLSKKHDDIISVDNSLTDTNIVTNHNNLLDVTLQSNIKRKIDNKLAENDPFYDFIKPAIEFL